MIDKRKIRVLVVDDSPAFRAALSLALETDLEIHIVGQAADGRAAVEMAHQLRPDVVTMDVMMPVLDGIEASKQILAERPIPILLMSTLARRDEQRMALNALRLGVVDVTNKPVLAGPGGQQGIQQVLRLVKAAADVAVTIQPIATRPMTPIAPPPSSPLSLSPSPSPSPTKPKLKLGPKVELIAVAASTGGPPALEHVLRGLPPDFPPVVVAQHLAPSFARGFADWLATALSRPVISVNDPEPLKRGCIYLAGEKRHLRVHLGFATPVLVEGNEVAPSADVLFLSVAASYGAEALGIVLTGMGDDGASGLRALRDAGGWTIGQDRASSVVYGMPRVAHEAGALCEIIPLDEIGRRLFGLVATKNRGTAQP